MCAREDGLLKLLLMTMQMMKGSQHMASKKEMEDMLEEYRTLARKIEQGFILISRIEHEHPELVAEIYKKIEGYKKKKSEIALVAYKDDIDQFLRGE
jgi:hypothetical protein